MPRIVILGGCGGVGTIAARAVATAPDFDQIVIADLRADAAGAVAAALGTDRARGAAVDAGSPGALRDLISGASVVLNCVGPFYRFGPPILRAAIEARVPYVDVCDDLDPTVHMLEMHEAARAAGVSALVGMGNSPGLANVFVRLCADGLLDQVESADILHIHGGEPEEGPAVLKHRIHAMVGEVPLFIDGAFVRVRQLEESGQRHVRQTDFGDLGTFPVYPYPHPETITLPKHIPGLRRATNLGVIFPLAYFRLTQDMVRVGACTEQPLEVQGAPVVPLEFSVAHILSRRARLLAEAGVTGPAGCLKVVVAGVKDGRSTSYELSLSSRSAGVGEGTGIPAAAGALLMHRGRVRGPGVLPPEAAVSPLEVFGVAFQMARSLGVGGGTDVRVEQIDGAGNRTPIPLSF